MKREKLKVLPNDLQDSIGLQIRMYKVFHKNEEPNIMDIMYRICGAKRYYPGRYNRVGRYKLNGKSWYEFLLPDGRYMSYIEDNTTMFDYELKIQNANENPLTDEEWEAVNFLINKRVLKNNERFSFESNRRYFKKLSIDSGIRIIQRKKRLSDKKKELGIV